MDQEQQQMSVYLAVSLDGYIATTEGNVDWLHHINGEGDNGYEHYYCGIDAVIMGRNTYETILTLDFPFPYSGKDCYVYTNSRYGADEHVTFINGTIDNLMSSLSTRSYTKCWICGGGLLISELINNKYITEFIVTIAPVILGSGIPLLTGIKDFQSLNLVKTTRYGQFVELHYDFTTE
ncbi:dihydrofolate reductase family protein [Paenibacillus antarcticus]|uniref:Bacterial bifunctional deaminase-reductase C-terminal domain-containing protein n=2 Tax=Paenibacillus antarcticus TaxID=253703 RepID=A0A168J6S7_9BACL|nr:dihydrofolate reductase family protein [Paenibacillus antarcticus]OAB40228.1 hypothetical protein PBAT_23225 [Paenibacillus antarcticus]